MIRSILDELVYRMRVLVGDPSVIQSITIEEIVRKYYDPDIDAYRVPLLDKDGQPAMFPYQAHVVREEEIEGFLHEAIIRHSGIFHRHSLRKKRRQ